MNNTISKLLIIAIGVSAISVFVYGSVFGMLSQKNAETIKIVTHQ